MTVSEREYMRGDRPADMPVEGIEAASGDEAAEILQWACPTKDAYGRWHRTTIAISNVPVIELYNILANASFCASRLREIAKDLPGATKAAIEIQADEIDSLRGLLQRPRIAIRKGQNVHSLRKKLERER